MKRLVLVLAGLAALACPDFAFAQASSIQTVCPQNYQCAFSAAESTPLGAKSPGLPDAYVGYLSFDGSSPPLVTIAGMQNLNGTVTSSNAVSGPCTSSLASGGVASITFSDGTQITFVSDGRGGNPTTTAPAELLFILTQNSSGVTTNVNVRVGLCREL